MVGGGAAIAGAIVGGPAGVAIGLVGGLVGGFIDQRLNLFGRSTKGPDVSGIQTEGIAPGTPFVYSIGQFNRVAGQRMWTSDIVRVQQAGVDKRGDQVPEIIRASWATAVAAHQIHSFDRVWTDSKIVYSRNTLQPDLTTAVGTLVNLDWWSTFSYPGGSGATWHMVIETASDAGGQVVQGAPNLALYGVGSHIQLELSDVPNGTQVSRKEGSQVKTPWIVVGVEELPKGNSRIMLNLLFDPNRASLNFGWRDKALPVPGPARDNGPFIYPITSGSSLLIENVLAPNWKGGLLADPASDFETRIGAADQDRLNLMVAKLGLDAEHFPAMAIMGFRDANLSDYGSRVPNSEALISNSAAPVYAGEAIDRVLGDRLGFRNMGFSDPEFDPGLLYSPPAGITAPEIHGYQWPAGLTGYEIIQPLLMVAGVRVHERSGRAILDWNARRDIVDLVVGDLDARPFGDRPGPLLEIEPAEELQAPDQIDLHFSDVDNNNQKQVATAVRQGLRVGSQDPIREDFRLEAFAMTYERATGLAQDLLREAWERRDGVRLRLPITYDYLEPGDVIRMAGNDAPAGGPWLLAIDRIEEGDMLEIECFVLSSPPITATAAGSTFDRDAPRIQSSAPLAFDIIDLGPLRDGDAQTPGYYVAASRFAPGNTPAGGSIWRKEPGETNPHRVGPITELAVMGSTIYTDASTNILGDAATDVIDETNSIDVQVFDGDLSSVTEAELLAGANRCVIGSEILAFRDAVALDSGPRHFRLSGLLRGRNGTEEATLGHQAGERFVFLGHRSDPLPINFVPAQLADVGTTHEVQVVHTGGSTDTVSEYPHPVEASTGRALPPYEFAGEVQENGDIVYTWFRRSRVAWDSLDEPPRLAAEERYELVLNGGARIKEVVGDPTDPANLASRTYTQAEQTADVVGLSISAEVRQIDPASGAGRTSSTTVTP